MKKLTIPILLIFNLFCSAQEEVFFNNITVDKKEIKVTKTVSGIGFNTDIIRFLPGRYMGYLLGSVETHFDYFHENRMADTWTLNKSIGLNNAFYNCYEYSNNLNNGYGFSQVGETYRYEMSLDIKLEPRWYFDQRLRYRHNKNTRNNTGWFLSVPLTLSAKLLSQPALGYSNQWVPEKLSLDVITPLTIGYRYAFHKNFFIEADAGYVPFRVWITNGSSYLKSAGKIGLFSADSFNSELKIAYVF